MPEAVEVAEEERLVTEVLGAVEMVLLLLLLLERPILVVEVVEEKM